MQDPKLQFHSSCQVKTTFSDGNGIKKSLEKSTVEPPLRPLIKWSGDVPSPLLPPKDCGSLHVAAPFPRGF